MFCGVSTKNTVVGEESIAIDEDLTKDRNLNTFKMYCKRGKSGPRSHSPGQKSKKSFVFV